MFFGVKELVEDWSVTPRGVLHVGAHMAEELDEYVAAGWNEVTWVEAQPDKVAYLRDKVPKHHKVIQAAVWDKAGVVLDFHISNNSQSSSLLDFGTHSESHPDIEAIETVQVTTTTLDDLVTNSKDIDFINLDLQGVELRALRGFTNGLKHLKWIYTEVNKEDVYRDCDKIQELDAFLVEHSFYRVATRWWANEGWGDALYVRANVDLPNSMNKTIARYASSALWEIKRLVRTVLR